MVSHLGQDEGDIKQLNMPLLEEGQMQTGAVCSQDRPSMRLDELMGELMLMLRRRKVPINTAFVDQS